jgi:hypothetical protein
MLGGGEMDIFMSAAFLIASIIGLVVLSVALVSMMQNLD